MSASYLLPEHHDATISVVPQTAEIVALCLEGAFDLLNTPALEAQIHIALDGGDNVILDFSETSFVDSSVIHVLVRAARSARARKQTIVLQRGTAPSVERVLEITKNEHLLPRAHDRKEALGMNQRQAATVSRVSTPGLFRGRLRPPPNPFEEAIPRQRTTLATTSRCGS